jgi:predicted permease
MEPMAKATRGHGLSIQDILRNKRIGAKRSRVERCFSVMKRVMMISFVYNLYQLRTLAKKKLA